MRKGLDRLKLGIFSPGSHWDYPLVGNQIVQVVLYSEAQAQTS